MPDARHLTLYDGRLIELLMLLDRLADYLPFLSRNCAP